MIWEHLLTEQGKNMADLQLSNLVGRINGIKLYGNANVIVETLHMLMVIHCQLAIQSPVDA